MRIKQVRDLVGAKQLGKSLSDKHLNRLQLLCPYSELSILFNPRSLVPVFSFLLQQNRARENSLALQITSADSLRKVILLANQLRKY